ncbi:MAG: cupin domain-containing protein [Verrucomicrobia bacterium]|nr:cupin domain-containing protein [Verrucomicrobiota bacterium]
MESGELEVNHGGEIIRANKGDLVYLPKNVSHAPSNRRQRTVAGLADLRARRF